MYNQYKRAKSNKKRFHTATIKTKYFMVVLLVILICVSVGYSLLSTKLYINGTVKGDIGLIVDPVSSSTSREGNSTWYTSNTALTGKPALLLPSTTLWVVDGESYTGSTIVTSIRQKQKALSSIGNVSATFTLIIRNAGSATFTNGSVTQVESSSAWSDVTATTSSTRLTPGNTVTITIKATLRSSRTAQSDDRDSFRISFKCGTYTSNFYWNFEFEP